MAVYNFIRILSLQPSKMAIAFSFATSSTIMHHQLISHPPPTATNKLTLVRPARVTSSCVSQMTLGPAHPCLSITSSQAQQALQLVETRPAEKVVYRCKLFKIYEDGHVQVRSPMREKPTPPVDNPFHVQFMDEVISNRDGITARVFMPEIDPEMPSKKFPVIFYVHGGSFCMSSPYAPMYHDYCTQLSAEAGAMVVSVDYGLFPDRELPGCYEDSWTALKWVASHASGLGPNPWIATFADLNKLFIVGDSAGANIAHTLAFRAGTLGLGDNVNLVGMAMMHPYFGGVIKDDLIWMKMFPNNQGLDDPMLNPPENHLAVLGCKKVLMFVAEKDPYNGPGKRYYEKLKHSGWNGKVELYENLGQKHCFHLRDFKQEQAIDMLKKVSAFVKA